MMSVHHRRVSQHILDLEQRAAELTTQFIELRQQQAVGSAEAAIAARQAQITAELDLVLVKLKEAEEQRLELLLELGFPPVIGYLSRQGPPTGRDSSHMPYTEQAAANGPDAPASAVRR
jgi:hypothetical protein